MVIAALQRDEERQQADRFVRDSFGPGVVPPFSFTYDGRSSSELLASWQFRQASNQPDDSRTQREFIYTDARSGLEVRCQCDVYLDFPAVEWVVTFTNAGNAVTPIIEDVQALETTIIRDNRDEFVLHRAEGAYGQGDLSEFAPVDHPMPPRSRVRLAPIEGQSSHISALPFFNIEAPGKGVVVGIGWSGQWAAELIRDGGVAMTVRAGMERTRLRLQPGERIRTPRILLVFWSGTERLRGQNMLRRLILLHHTPRQGSEPVMMPFACSGSALSDMGNDATEQNQIDMATAFARLGIETDYFLLDPGWAEGGWPNGSGNWSVKKNAFPSGLRGLSDALGALSMHLIVGFEPEMVKKGTWLDTEHPEWVLRLSDGWAGLLNLGDPDARRWLIERSSSMIDTERIKVFRQQSDWYMDLARFWKEADEPDREGLTEIRWIEGLYAFWDELLARHPGLIIDNCTHGGRRLDLECISRTLPLLRSVDSYGQPHIRVPEARPDPYYGGVCQSHAYALNLWLPCSSAGSNEPATYEFRAALGAGMLLRWNPYAPSFSKEAAQHLVREFKEARPYFYGDFYPLTPHSIRDDVWMAYQFHREDLKAGLVLAFRRPNSFDSTVCLKLGGLVPSARYQLDDKGSGSTVTLTGEQLASGMEVRVDEAPGSVFATYHELP